VDGLKKGGLRMGDRTHWALGLGMLMVVALATATLAQAAAPTISLQALSLTRDAPGHKLATPTSLDRASPTVPYGASVLVEVRVAGDAPIVAVDGYKVLPSELADVAAAIRTSQRWLDETMLFDNGSSGDQVAGDGIWSRELRFPYCCKGKSGVGPCTFAFVALDAEGRRSEPVVVTFTGQAPSATGGSPPVVTFAGSVPGNPSGPPGTPFLITARVTDPDNAIAQVMAQSPYGSALYLNDDGTDGDAVAGDGVWSRIWVIGDVRDGRWWPEQRERRQLQIIAIDLAGNVSQPASVSYEARFDQEILPWGLEGGMGPSIPDAGMNLSQGPLASTIIIWARTDTPECFVMANALLDPWAFDYLHDDGSGGDARAGDGIFTYAFKLPAGAARGYYEILLYALPKDGRLTSGRRTVLTFHALEPDRPLE